MSDYTQMVILCEDLQQAAFARTFFAECGVNPRRMRIVKLPKTGAGESFVKREYPKEIRALRQRANSMQIGLVVVIDADHHSVNDRLLELENLLEQAQIPPRQPSERVGIFVPKRNIETWIYYLMGKTVDEEQPYAHFESQAACKPVVKALAQKRHLPLPDDAPNSLKAACEELPHLL